MHDEGTRPPREGKPMTYNRMEAKPMAGEHAGSVAMPRRR